MKLAQKFLSGCCIAVFVASFINTPVLSSVSSDLIVSQMTNNTSSSVNGGAQFDWEATIVNNGSASASFAAGETVFTNDLPAVNSIDNISIDYGVGNSTGSFSCTTADPVVCTADPGGFSLFGSSGNFSIQITVTAPYGNIVITNPDGTCSVDPLDAVSEDDETNNDCPSDPVTVQTADIIVHKLNTIESGNAKFNVPFSWAFEIENIGDLPADFENGDVIFQDQLPPGADYVSTGPLTASEVRAQNGVFAVIDCVIDLNLLFTCTLTSGGPLTVAGAIIPIGSVQVTPTIASGNLVNPSGGICRVDPNNEIAEVNDEVNGTDNNDCSDTVIVQTPFEKLPATETIRASATYNASFWCGERKEEFTMDGKDFFNLEQYETEIEIVYPQKRILGIFPLPQEEALLVESATLTEPSNFQTPGVMTVPVKNNIRGGKTIQINCEDILEHPTSINSSGDIDQLLTQVLSGEDYFHGVMTIDSSVSDVRIFVTKIVRSWKGVDQGSGLDVVDSQLDRDRYEVEGLRSSNLNEVNFVVPENALNVTRLQQDTQKFYQTITQRQRTGSILFTAKLRTTQAMSIKVYSLNGQHVFSSTSSGHRLSWQIRDELGRPVANGVYLYVVSTLDETGRVVRSEIKKLLVIR